MKKLDIYINLAIILNIIIKKRVEMIGWWVIKFIFFFLYFLRTKLKKNHYQTKIQQIQIKIIKIPIF